MQASKEDIAAMPSDRATATEALQQLSIKRILVEFLEHPATFSSFWNYQSLTLGAWPLIRETSNLQSSSAYQNSSFYKHFTSPAEMMKWTESHKSNISKIAKQSVQKLDFIGLTETFDQSTFELFARIGLPAPGEIQILNARSSYADENDDTLRQSSAHLLELDYELYEFAKERQAQMGRMARGSPRRYLERALSAHENTIYDASEQPGGHGWHLAHQRSDGQWSRWTTGEGRSYFALAGLAGRYDLEIKFWGAVSEAAIMDLELEIDGVKLSKKVSHLNDGILLLSSFERQSMSSFDLTFIVPNIVGSYGVELCHLMFSPKFKPQSLAEPQQGPKEDLSAS
jgi:hypothetical protein